MRIFVASISAIAALSLVTPLQEANAHPGRTAKDGCHNDRKNGGRHCHSEPNAGKVVRQPSSDQVYYPNCAAARRAGVTPILLGQPGYGRHLDRDGDGRACEYLAQAVTALDA